jgi:hypothetical protein
MSQKSPKEIQKNEKKIKKKKTTGQSNIHSKNRQPVAECQTGQQLEMVG